MRDVHAGMTLLRVSFAFQEAKFGYLIMLKSPNYTKVQQGTVATVRTSDSQASCRLHRRSNAPGYRTLQGQAMRVRALTRDSPPSAAIQRRAVAIRLHAVAPHVHRHAALESCSQTRALPVLDSRALSRRRVQHKDFVRVRGARTSRASPSAVSIISHLQRDFGPQKASSSSESAH